MKLLELFSTINEKFVKGKIDFILDPTPRELQAALHGSINGHLRGLDYGNHIVFWDAYEAEHTQMGDLLHREQGFPMDDDQSLFLSLDEKVPEEGTVYPCGNYWFASFKNGKFVPYDEGQGQYLKVVMEKLSQAQINESPLVDYSWMGPDTPQALQKPTTHKIAKSPGAKAKAIRMFQNTPWPIKVVFYNIIPAKKNNGMGGDTYKMRYRKDIPRDNNGDQFTMDGDYTHELPRVPPDPDAMTFVINSDDGHDFQQFSPWMIAHRMGHALENHYEMKAAYAGLNGNLTNLSKYVGPAHIPSILHHIGKFKSARDERLGSTFEFLMDCFAQYLIQGKVSFNRMEENAPVGTRNSAKPFKAVKFTRDGDGLSIFPTLPHEYIKKFNDEFKMMEKKLNAHFRELMKSIMGKVYAI